MNNRLSRNLEKLPPYAAVEHPTERTTVIVERGVVGYVKPPYAVDAQAFNRLHEVSPAQAAAMLAGSMFGFHVPAADPEHPAHQQRLGALNTYRRPEAGRAGLQAIESAFQSGLQAVEAHEQRQQRPLFPSAPSPTQEEVDAALAPKSDPAA